MAYLDNSATTQVCREAVDRMVTVMTEQYGNPSSLHSMGFAAEQVLTGVRREVATLVGADPEDIIFTSGGTEANNLAILGGADACRRRAHKAVVSGVEHSSVAACFTLLEKQGWEIARVMPDRDGTISVDRLEEACTPDTSLVSLMAVNNETGARFDIPAAVAAVRRIAPDALFHTDCVQAAGKIPVCAVKWGVDLLSCSSHKLHGPKGAGALYLRKGVRILPRQIGGGQERTLRGGTEAVPALAGFGAAAAAVPLFARQEERYTALRCRLLEGVADIPGVRLHLPPGGVPYIVNLAVMGYRSETLLHFLAERGVFVSGGSACSRGKKSPVLMAMGLPEAEVDSSLRISFGYDNTHEDIDRFCQALHEAVAGLRRRT